MKASVVVASKDKQVHEALGQFFSKFDYDVQFKEAYSSILLAVFKHSIQMIVLDVEENDEFALNCIGIIRQTHPGVTIVALCENTSVERVRDLSQRGVFYCAMKPVQSAEMKKVMEAYERLQQKRENESQVLSYAAHSSYGTV